MLKNCVACVWVPEWNQSHQQQEHQAPATSNSSSKQRAADLTLHDGRVVLVALLSSNQKRQAHQDTAGAHSPQPTSRAPVVPRTFEQTLPPLPESSLRRLNAPWRSSQTSPSQCPVRRSLSSLTARHCLFRRWACCPVSGEELPALTFSCRKLWEMQPNHFFLTTSIPPIVSPLNDRVHPRCSNVGLQTFGVLRTSPEEQKRRL